MSVQGTSHVRSGQTCQDAQFWEVWREDTLVAAVADGAGSAPLAEVGAAVAANAAVAAFLSKWGLSKWGLSKEGVPPNDKKLLSQLRYSMKAAQRAVKKEAAAREVPVSELATTLILVVATPELVAAAQVGDGAAVVDDGKGEITNVTVPRWGEYINETTFLNSRGALKKAQVNVCRGTPKHVAVLSDGLQMLALKMPEGTPHRPFFAPLFKFVSEVTDSVEAHRQLELFLRSQRVADSTGDDLTLLLFSLA